MPATRRRRLGWLVSAALAGATLGCGSNPPSAPSGAGVTDFAGQFNLLWTTFDQNYSYFVYKAIDWNAIRAEFQPRAAAATSQAQFNSMALEMLGRLHDQHVLINGPGTTLRTYVPPYFINWDEGVWRQYLARGNSTARGGVVSAVMNGVAYMAVTSWNPTFVGTNDLDAALDAFLDRPALIVDVRMNGGGNDQIAFQFAGRFATATTTSGFVQTRNGPSHGDFTPLQPRMFLPRGVPYTGSVVLLVGRLCLSSNESFVAAMRQLPNVTVVGDTTGGASANPQTFPLTAGWTFTVSRWIEYLVDGQGIEDHGIAPSVFVPVSGADFQSGRDPVIDWALEHLSRS